MYEADPFERLRVVCTERIALFCGDGARGRGASARDLYGSGQGVSHVALCLAAEICIWHEKAGSWEQRLMYAVEIYHMFSNIHMYMLPIHIHKPHIRRFLV